MSKILKLSAIVCCLIAGSCLMATSKAQLAPVDQKINTVALALKAPANTEVSLTGKLVVVKTKVYLQDSTGKILIAAPRFQLEMIAEDSGQNVTATGKITKNIWCRLGFKDPVLTINDSQSVTNNISTDTDLKK
ncbi:MAG: hypothetical protein WCR55_13840 [Lentisphaerota bacterium]